MIWSSSEREEAVCRSLIGLCLFVSLTCTPAMVLTGPYGLCGLCSLIWVYSEQRVTA